MTRTLSIFAIGFVFVLAVIVGLQFVPRANQGAYPTGLSAETRARFETYERKVIDTLRGLDRDEVRPLELANAFFIRTHLVPHIRDVFGDDWLPIRKYVEAALAALPRVDETERLSGAPRYMVDLRIAEQGQFRLATTSPEYEEVMAASRHWDPYMAAVSASKAALGAATKTVKMEAPLHSFTMHYLSRQLARTTWRNREALLLYQGTWVFAILYERTPRGLILPTEVGIYPR